MGVLPLHGHVYSLCCVSGPAVSQPLTGVQRPYSVNRWTRPSEPARFRSGAKCCTLGRTPHPSSAFTVCGSVPRRRFRSAHGRSDSSLNRTSRCGESLVKA